jgi:putrescine transport system ATP-binding protein
MAQDTQVSKAGVAAGQPGNAAATSPVDDYVQVLGITKDFDNFRAVDNATFSIRKGEIFALLGASGCGKSTLLRVLAGFETPTSGRILLDGQDIASFPPYRRPINMMFQSYALFPHMSVEKNIAFGLKQDRMPKAEMADRVAELLKLVRMSEYAHRKPHQLSGGQQQRVALARSLAKGPKLLLLDEPMAALDKKLRGQMQLEVVDIIERLGVTCIMVTHDQDEAMTMANRIAVMERGVIRQIGRPDDIYELPTCRFTAEFIGSVNIFDGRIVEDFPDYVVIQADALTTPVYVGHGITGFEDMTCAVAVRPEKMTLSKEEPAQEYNKACGVIQDIAYFGSHSAYYVRLPSGYVVRTILLNAERWAGERFTWNDEVWVCWGDNSAVVLTA